ncbi:MAG: hypothetical protein L3J11_02250 [Draconibacterium sp.]|nr:hypothetical protein [Draconibacterium sp.]
MENKKRSSFIKGTLVAGALLSVTALSAMPSSSSLFNYNALGSGAEVRTEILHGNANPFNNFEAKCGEKSTTKAEAKSSAAKCGDGTCGEGDKKAATKKSNAKASEAKASEAKCGEGTCGEGDKKATKKAARKAKKEKK